MRKLFLVLSLLFLVFGLSGCTLPFGLFQKQKVTLKYWGLWEPVQVIQPLIDEYQKANPHITIEYKKMSPPRYRETVTARLAENVGPDIFRFHNTWLPMLKNDLAAVPEKIMSSSEMDKVYYPVIKKDLKLGNQYFGIPLEIDTLGLYINSDILKASGTTPPNTWEEFKNLAEKLTVKDAHGTILTAGAALGTFNNVEHASDILALMFLQNSTDLGKIDNTVLSDGSNAGVDALNYYVSFAKGEHRVWDETLDNSMNAFASGKLAMFFGPSWQAFDIKTLNPNLNFIVVSVPQLSGTNLTWASFWVEGVAKKSKNQEEAFKFLKWLSDKEQLKKLYNNASKLRLFGEPYPRTDMADLIKDDPLAGAFVKQAPHATSWWLASRTFDNGLNDKMISYLTDTINAVAKDQATAKSALGTAASGINQLLSQYGLKSGGQVR